MRAVSMSVEQWPPVAQSEKTHALAAVALADLFLLPHPPRARPAQSIVVIFPCCVPPAELIPASTSLTTSASQRFTGLRGQAPPWRTTSLGTSMDDKKQILKLPNLRGLPGTERLKG